MTIDPKQRVRKPGIFLLILGILIEVYSIIFFTALILIDYTNYKNGIYPNASMGKGFFLSQAVVLIVTAIHIFTAPIIIYGANQMLKLKNYNLSLVGAVLAMLPSSICCVLGFPIGVWVLVTLVDKELKAEFS
jgi:hypothetical protein